MAQQDCAQQYKFLHFTSLVGCQSLVELRQLEEANFLTASMTFSIGARSAWFSPR